MCITRYKLLVITSATTKQGAARKLHKEILWRCQQLRTLDASTNFPKDRYVTLVACNSCIAALTSKLRIRFCLTCFG